MAGIENITSVAPEAESDEGPENEIEIEIDLDTNEVSVDYEEGPQLALEDIGHFDNLVPYIDEKDLDHIGEMVIEGLEADEGSRSEWVDGIEAGLKMLGLKIEEVSEPFDGACGAHHPLILESAVKFQSKASLELFPAAGPVKTQILGIPTPEKEAKAGRKKRFLNYKITEDMPEYYTEGERLLFATGLMGTSFRKIGYNPLKDLPSPEFIDYKHFVVADTAKSLEDHERYTHIVEMTANEMLRAFANGTFIEPENTISPSSDESLGQMEEIKGFVRPQDDRSRVYTILEQHVNLNLPEPFSNEYDIADPYIIRVEKESGKVLSIVRNWDENNDSQLTRQKLLWFVPWHFVPGMGFHSFGYIHLLGNLQLTLTTVLRSLIDSGQFANLQGGFKLKGVKIAMNDSNPISPGEFREVEATVDDLDKAIKTLPFKEPSNVLYNMLSFVEARSQKFADSTEQVVNEATNYGPVGTTMALLEASTKFYSAIHKRLHASQRQELKIITRIFEENVIKTDYPYEEDGNFDEDFDESIDIVPVSDPNIPSAAHRMMMANAALDIALKVPGLANQREAVRASLQAMGNMDVDKIIPPEDKPENLDPISDIEAAIGGKPIKAFPGQDHMSHIKIKTAWLQDPMNGASPVMKAAAPMIEANIREHMMLAYREQVAGQLSSLSQEDVSKAPSEEYVVALAAEKAAKLNEALAKQMEGPDPMEKVADAEMIKAKTAEAKQKHEEVMDFAEASLDAQRLGLDIVKEQNRHAEKSKALAADTKKINFGTGRDLIKIAQEQLKKGAVDSNKKKG